MSKRRGEFVTLDDLIDEIGVDATRFFMLARSHDSTIDLDLDLARAASRTRTPSTTCSTRTRASPRSCARRGDERVARALAARGADVELHPTERALVKKLLAFPDEVAEAAERRAPHRIAAYALELAQDFTAFYRDCQVVGAEPEALEDVAPAPVRRRAADDRPRARPARRARHRTRCERRARRRAPSTTT